MAFRRVEVTHFLAGEPAARRETRELIAEEALVIEIAGGASYTIMRTPGNDRELAAGFLLSEGIIGGKADLGAIAECPDDSSRIRVTLARAGGVAERRNLAVLSSCGLCGRDGIEDLVAGLPAVGAGVEVPLRVLYDLPGKVKAGQALFRETGGSHAAALFEPDGKVVVLREDLGRHNALDKAIGHALLAGIETATRGAFLSGRVSLEMVIKAARAGIPFVAAVSAASAAAVEVAERVGITLCGFVRGGEVTVYSHPGRIGVQSTKYKVQGARSRDTGNR